MILATVPIVTSSIFIRIWSNKIQVAFQLIHNFYYHRPWVASIKENINNQTNIQEVSLAKKNRVAFYFLNFLSIVFAHNPFSRHLGIKIFS